MQCRQRWWSARSGVKGAVCVREVGHKGWHRDVSGNEWGGPLWLGPDLRKQRN